MLAEQYRIKVEIEKRVLIKERESIQCNKLYMYFGIGKKRIKEIEELLGILERYNVLQYKLYIFIDDFRDKLIEMQIKSINLEIKVELDEHKKQIKSINLEISEVKNGKSK